MNNCAFDVGVILGLKTTHLISWNMWINKCTNEQTEKSSAEVGAPFKKCWWVVSMKAQVKQI